jgi:hypothetical protein
MTDIHCTATNWNGVVFLTTVTGRLHLVRCRTRIGSTLPRPGTRSTEGHSGAPDLCRTDMNSEVGCRRIMSGISVYTRLTGKPYSEKGILSRDLSFTQTPKISASPRRLS